jgi:SAM-dependent methyltransferase
MSTPTPAREEWYTDFFQGINCELWENAIPLATTLQEIKFLSSQLNCAPGAAILDIPCGFGRHAVELARAGYRVTGVDISDRFLLNLERQARTENLSISIYKGDMLEVDWGTGFSGAICMGNSFGYFSIVHMKQWIEKVAGSLLPGARFIVNSGMIAECILPNFRHYTSNNIYTVGDIRMEVDNQYDLNGGFMTSHLLYTKNGHTEAHAYRHYIFTLAEVSRLFARYGLVLIHAFGSADAMPFQLGDRQVYLVAEKNKSPDKLTLT